MYTYRMQLCLETHPLPVWVSSSGEDDIANNAGVCKDVDAML